MNRCRQRSPDLAIRRGVRLPPWLLQVVVSLFLGIHPVQAEVSPTTTVVVINAASPASGQVARRWIALRHIAEDHVVALDGVPTAQRMSLADFRRLILEP